MTDLLTLLLLGIPMVVIIFFVVSLERYLVANRKNREYPGSFSSEEKKKGKVLLIASAALAIALVALIVGMILLLTQEISFM